MYRPSGRPATLIGVVVALAVATASGCASQGKSATPAPAAHTSPGRTVQAESTAIDNEPSAADSPLIDYPVRPFPSGSMYDLLVAEFAGMRGDLALAVAKYHAQALATRDPNVLARAVQTASYARDRAVVEELGYLWAEIEPDNLEANRVAFYFAARDNEVEAALNYAQRLLDLGDGDAIVSLPGFTEKLDPEKRAPIIDRYNALSPDLTLTPKVLLGRLRLESQQGDLDQALITGETLLDLEPDNEDARLVFAQVLYGNGLPDNAMRVLREGIERRPNSKKLNLLMIRFIADNDLEEAHARLSTLVELYQDDVDLLYSLALLNKQLGFLEDARSAFKKMISHNRRVADAHYHLADIADRGGDVDEALSNYALVGEGEHFMPALARMTTLMMDRGQMTEARLYLHRLRLHNPEMVVPLYRLESELLMGARHYDSAYSLLTEGLTDDPHNFDLLYTRSLVSEKRRDIKAVEQDLRAILVRDKNNASALNALGYSLTNHTTRYQEALSLIRKAHALSPDDAAIIDSLGWVLYRLGNTEEALAYLRRAMATIPDSEVAAHLGEVLWVTGNRREAMKIWREGLENDPDSEYLNETMDRFQASP